MNTYYFYKWEIRSGHLVLYIILKRKKGEKIVRDRKAYPLCLVSQRMKIDALHVINLTLFEPQCICRLSVLWGTNEVIFFYINYIQWKVETRENDILFFLNIICCVCYYVNDFTVSCVFVFCYVFELYNLRDTSCWVKSIGQPVNEIYLLSCSLNLSLNKNISYSLPKGFLCIFKFKFKMKNLIKLWSKCF